MKKCKILIYMTIVMFCLTYGTISVYAITSGDIAVTSPSYGYHLQGNSCTYSVTIANAVNNPATVKIKYPYYEFNSTSRSSLITLTRSGSTYIYTGTCTPYVYAPGRKVGSHGTWESRRFYVEATKSGTTVSTSASGYITAGQLSDYTTVDSTFYYNGLLDNSFTSVGTPNPSIDSLTYNCLAYAVGINTNWEWPWSSNPTMQQLDDYMAKSGSYASRSGDKFIAQTSRQNCDVIYYSDNAWGSGSDGHFAKVIAWDSSGYPTMISSKWGQMELIESTSYNPFTGSSSPYGTAKRYYKYN